MTARLAGRAPSLAYLGYFTLIAADRVGDRGHVLALEPHPESYAALVENVRENGYEDRVTALPIALADGRGRADFTLDSNPPESGLCEPSAGCESIEVECASLDELLAVGPTPDLVKLDVEGSEVSAVAGMRRTLAGARSDFVMILELNPGALHEAGSGPGDLLGRLTELGLRIRVIDERTGRIESLDYERLTQRHWVNLWVSDPPVCAPGSGLRVQRGDRYVGVRAG